LIYHASASPFDFAQKNDRASTSLSDRATNVSFDGNATDRFVFPSYGKLTTRSLSVAEAWYIEVEVQNQYITTKNFGNNLLIPKYFRIFATVNNKNSL
jgi:hypothetical protein